MLAVQALTNRVANYNYPQCDQTNNLSLFSKSATQKPLTRRHTIQSMPLSSASLLVNPNCENQAYDIHLTKNINLENQLVPNQIILQSPSKNYADSKAYVGSFNQVTQSPQRRQSSLKPDDRLACYEKQEEVEDTFNLELDASVSCKHVNNHFNNDFYRLCSGEAFEESSENNLNHCNYSNSNNSLQMQRNLHIKKLNAKDKTHLQEHPNSNSHVSNPLSLFDQWLVNKNLNGESNFVCLNSSKKQ